MREEVTRQIFWNVPEWIQVLMYLFFFITLFIMLFGIFKRFRMWRKGRGKIEFDNLLRRFKDFLIYGIGHKRILRDRFSGIMHLLIFVGFLVLFIGTDLITIEQDTPAHFFFGSFYLIYSFVMDFHGVIFGLGIGLALYRRYYLKPEKLENTREDLFILLLFLTIALTGFLIEALRIAVTKPSFEVWSFAGYTISKFLTFSEETARSLHLGLWVIHAALTFVFIILFTKTKLFHIFSSPLNIFFRSYKSKGALNPILNIEEAETIGVSKMKDFTWKQLLDFDACTKCGRCQEVCPAYAAKTPLSPKNLILELKECMEDNFLKGKESGIYDFLEANEIWSCTTCRACVEECPVFIEHLDEIVELRRSLNFEGKVPPSASKSLQYILNRGNPWGFAKDEREKWAEGLGVPVEKGVEILYFVGCAGAYDPRAQKITKAMVEIIGRAKIKFAILGNSEICCGDGARRLGEEALFQMLAQQNIQLFQDFGVKKILTHCPHCFNTFKNEYPQFDGEFEVIHHSQFISELLKDERIQVERGKELTVLHDSCYLGRYNEIYDEPREIMKAFTENTLELERSRDRGFCCGGGGGHMWMDLHLGKRINHLRLEQALERNPKVIASSCPFCLLMFDDASKFLDVEEKVKLRDIAELVLEVIK
ncbi:MAG: heterodisulfide reductase-related iron-sulfur binding cluster [Candidatus Methanofastidiosia archaeon]